MADTIKIGAELTLDNKKLKTDFTKAGEEAGKSVAQGLEKQQGTIIDSINDTINEIKIKIETLKEIDWQLIDPDKAEEGIQFLDNELNSLTYTVENLKYGWQEFGDEGAEAFASLNDEVEDYKDEIEIAKNNLEGLGEKTAEAMDGAKEKTEETTEAVKELNQEAEKGISENGGLGKMLKFLSSKEIINFFYRNLKKIGEKLIDLSGDAEMLANKFQPVQEKLEAVGGYIGKGLTPVIEGVIDDLDTMVDDLIKTGEAGKNSASVIQKGVYIVGTAIRGLINLIRSFGVFLGSVFGGLKPVVVGLFTDLYDTAKSVIEGIGNVENWKALGNNIKYGIVQGVNGAIESVNGLLNWLNSKLGIDLGNIKTFDAGEKQSFNFGDINGSNTKNAIEAYTQTMNQAMEDVGKEWYNFIQDTKKGWDDLGNTAIDTNKKIKDNTEKTLGGGGGSKKNSVAGVYEKLEEEAMDVWEQLDSLVEDHQKIYDKLNEQIDKVGDEYDKLRDKAKDTWKEAQKALEDYNNELQKVQGEAVSDLGQRYVELQESRRELENDYLKRIVSEISDNEWKNIRDEGWTYKGYSYEELKKVKEIYDEMKLIEENTTEEQRKSVEFTEKTSEAQKILNKLKEQEAELEEKKAVALEKQAIAQAMQDNENGKQNILISEKEDSLRAWYKDMDGIWQEIQDKSNIEYAKQLEEQITGLNSQLEEFKKEKDNEVEILIDTTAAKIDLENNYQKVFEENVKKQEKSLDNLIVKEQKLIDLRREYLSMGGSVGHNAYGGSILSGGVSVVGENGPETIIARQSSYVQPRNAGSSYNTINNDNSFSINGINVNVSNIDEFLNELKEKLTYRN